MPDIENLVKLTVDQMHEGIQILDMDLKYLYLNAAAAKHGRRSSAELLGRTMKQCYPGIEATDMYRLLRRVIENDEPGRMENQFSYPDGTKNWFALYFEPHAMGVLIRSIDISAAKKLEEQFLHAQKMEAVGRLAGGVAHDFNNKMGIIQIYADMGLQRVGDTDEVMKRYLESIVKAVGGASKVTRQLLAYSRKQVLDLKVSNLNEVVSSMTGGLLALLGSDLRFEVDLDPELGNARVDPSQIDQVIMNLALNARDAMDTGGVLTIETSNVELDRAFCSTRAGLSPGRYVMLSVSDTGAGIPPEVKDKIFDPFYTTKEPGKGTGLGLSSVFGIVQQSNGYVWVYSEVGIGTTFKIYFPLVEGEKDSSPLEVLDDTSPLKGDETILLVEDDEMLREALARALGANGYSVCAAASPEHAKQAFMDQKGRIHLLLTDVVLGSASGRVLADELAAMNGKMKIAFMSGYTENSITHHGILEDGAILIQKPVSIRKLQTTIRKILDGQIKKGIL